MGTETLEKVSSGHLEEVILTKSCGCIITGRKDKEKNIKAFYSSVCKEDKRKIMEILGV